jgi:energy-coupling factor transporter ATP-binding protein EcfA2
MYISKIELKNIRGFTDLSFDMDRGDGTFAGWTVFTGDNGSGKSTLLKAIAVGLAGPHYAPALEPNITAWMRRARGITNGTIQLDLVRVREDDDSITNSSSMNYVRSIISMNSSSAGPQNTLAQSENAGSVASDITFHTKSPVGWFSCGYGPYRRVFGASPEATRLMSAPATERYVTMFQEAASLYEVTNWLQDLKFKELEGRTEESKPLSLLMEILQDDLLPNGFVVDRVDSDGLWLNDCNGVELAWTDMSDGYRSALALLADIFRHLVKTYGISGLTDRDAEGKLFVKRSGVVLIDEVDAHMHPEWQREIGFWLKNHFPNIQFLVTSHSPIICQAADPNGLFVLPEPGGGDVPRALTTEEYQKVIRSRPDTILLSPAFALQNTRSDRVVEARAEYGKLQSKQRATGRLTESEEAKVKELRPLAVTDEEL